MLGSTRGAEDAHAVVRINSVAMCNTFRIGIISESVNGNGILTG